MREITVMRTVKSPAAAVCGVLANYCKMLPAGSLEVGRSD